MIVEVQHFVENVLGVLQPLGNVWEACHDSVKVVRGAVPFLVAVRYRGTLRAQDDLRFVEEAHLHAAVAQPEQDRMTGPDPFFHVDHVGVS